MIIIFSNRGDSLRLTKWNLKRKMSIERWWDRVIDRDDIISSLAKLLLIKERIYGKHERTKELTIRDKSLKKDRILTVLLNRL